MKTRNGMASCAIVLALGCGVSHAIGDDYLKEPFSLRFPAAISRFSPYADVAAVGGASAASKWSSSVNPAATGWLGLTGKLRLSPCAQYVPVLFSNGTDLHVTAESLNWQVDGWGTFQPSLAQVRSNRETTKQGLDFETDLDLYQFQWGKRFGDWALGASFNFTSSDMAFGVGDSDAARSRGESYAWRLGVLHQPAEHWLAGLVVDYGFTRSRTRMYDLFDMGVGTTDSADTGHQLLLRPGVSYEYKKDSSVYFDYQVGAFWEGTGGMMTHRFHFGVDHQLFEGFAVRAGAAIDANGEVTWTCGLGIYPTDWVTIDVSFQENAMPELSPEFGKARTFSVSIGFSF